MSDLWLSAFTKCVWNPYGLGYASAYSNGKPTPLDASPAGLVHSTEGSSLPVYRGGKDNPNFTIDPWRRKRYQHVPANVAARALMAHNEAVVQIEIIGFCDMSYAKKYNLAAFHLSNLSPEGVTYIAESLKIIGAALNIPATSSVKWVNYPASYGSGNGIRLSLSNFKGYKGWLGHQHAPDNDHGDPGDFFPRVLAQMAHPASKPATTPPVVKPPVTSTFPLPANQWYGLNDKTARSHSGLNDVDRSNIKRIQTKLKIAADGSFGPKTAAAVLTFQKARPKVLLPDQKVGMATWHALGL